MHARTHGRSVSPGHIRFLLFTRCSTHTDALEKRCCLIGVHFIMLLFSLTLHFLHLRCGLQMTPCCQNNEQLRAHTPLSSSFLLSLGIFQVFFPLRFFFFWRFLMPSAAVCSVCQKKTLIHVNLKNVCVCFRLSVWWRYWRNMDYRNLSHS